METNYWETLELPAVLARLAEFTSFSAGHALALALTPAADFDAVNEIQRETAEARHLMDVKPDFRLGGVHDLRPSVENAVRGARLLPQDLLDVRDTLSAARVLRQSLLRSEDTFPRLADMGRLLDPCPDLVAEIQRCIGEHGDVLDNATSTLAHLRAELRVAYDRLIEKLNRLLARSDYAKYFQEAYVTQRDGRYVIPVRSEFKARIPGLVHDQSASGATLFIEPLATVDLNNRWRELQLSEQREVERILLALSGRVADHAESIVLTVEALARLDLALSRAKYADATRSTMPEIVPFEPRYDGPRGTGRLVHPGSVLELRQARHPLLDPRTVVPIDVYLNKESFVIVITGPNTGGKTVSLKTVGLLALMAQCGLHLPVDEGSRLTVFEHVCADIGDEQSIEQSLSTFSSHMSHIIDILERVDDRSLVLLDELGAGTDPVEGAALARSLLVHLIQRRVTTLATTHYPQLKIFADETPEVANASVEFDVETLSPTYRLIMGLPGQSNAFAIARRLSLPEPIVRRAQSLVSSSHLEAERFLAQLKERDVSTAQLQREIQEAHQAAQDTAAELRARLADIEREREQMLAQARAQAAEEIDQVRRDLRALQRRMAGISAAPSELKQLAVQLDKLEREQAPIQPLRIQAPPASSLETIDVGDTVWVVDLNAIGQVLAFDGEAVEVQVGSFRVRTRRSSLELRGKASARNDGEDESRLSLPPAPAVSLELHLRGMRLNEALVELEKYLDSAYRSQAPFVTIVHGKGQGVLRKAVRDYLSSHPLISSFRSGAEGEGDTGVTVAHFVGG